MILFIAYLRVRLGIEAQRAAVAQHVASAGGQIVAEVVEAESGKRGDRPELARALAASVLRSRPTPPAVPGCFGLSSIFGKMGGRQALLRLANRVYS